MKDSEKQPEGYLSQDQAGINDTDKKNSDQHPANDNKKPEDFLSQDQAGVNGYPLPVNEDKEAEENEVSIEKTKSI